MAFKDDWSFLDKITMGAIGTQKVIELLNESGHRIIELERYCTSNKIWATKIKRLRIPDLVCLKCGRRIESRAKSKLGIIMSDSPTNQERRWNAGLREEDLVSFIYCSKDTNDRWIASNTINIFNIEDLERCEELSRLGPPKSASEGAERDRTWSSYVPGFSCIVDEINGTQIKLLKNTGGRFSKTVPEGHSIYVQQGDIIPGNAMIVHSVVSTNIDTECNERDYDFIADLHSTIKETKYTAVKALGFLHELSEQSIPELYALLGEEDLDERIRLEIYSSLARLGEDAWDNIKLYISSDISAPLKMETVFILGELSIYPEAQNILRSIIQNTDNSGELRSAAIWSLGHINETLPFILNFVADNDDIVANHAIALIEKTSRLDLTQNILEIMQLDDIHGAIGARLLSTCTNFNDRAIIEKYVNSRDESLKGWLLYTIGLSGSERFSNLLNELDPNATESIKRLTPLWVNQKSYLSKDTLDNIEFLKLQKIT
jgi:HEAT repeat protein